MGLFSKNNIQEYKDLEDYSNFLDSLLSKDDYISRKEYLVNKNKLDETYKRMAGDVLKEDIYVKQIKWNL